MSLSWNMTQRCFVGLKYDTYLVNTRTLGEVTNIVLRYLLTVNIYRFDQNLLVKLIMKISAELSYLYMTSVS